MAAHESKWKKSQYVLYPLLALAIALEQVFPSSIPLGSALLRNLIGAFFVTVGLFVTFRARHILQKHAQPSRPGTPTTQLIKDDIFGFSRNPIYLGALLVFCGLSPLLDSLWILSAAGMSFVVLSCAFIRPEERYLAMTFGEEFLHYCRKTNRWL